MADYQTMIGMDPELRALDEALWQERAQLTMLALRAKVPQLVLAGDDRRWLVRVTLAHEPESYHLYERGDNDGDGDCSADCANTTCGTNTGCQRHALRFFTGGPLNTETEIILRADGPTR